jgi:hypothetical protein
MELLRAEDPRNVRAIDFQSIRRGKAMDVIDAIEELLNVYPFLAHLPYWTICIDT